jgi:hypothetical protein
LPSNENKQNLINLQFSRRNRPLHGIPEKPGIFSGRGISSLESEKTTRIAMRIISQNVLMMRKLPDRKFFTRER